MLQSFNIEAAKAGAKVVTRSGKPARIVCFDRVDEKWKGNLVVLLLNKECPSCSDFGTKRTVPSVQVYIFL